jgi:hypothetical protein
MNNVLLWLVRIFAICVVIQVFFAGAALFADSDYWTFHKVFPRFFALLPIVMIVLSFFTKLPTSVRMKCFQLFGMIILILLTVILSKNIGVLAGLHPVIAIMLFVTSMSIAKQIVASNKEYKVTTVSDAPSH